MTIKVKFFASLREEVGRAEVELAVEQATTIEEVWVRVAGRPLTGPVLAALNMEYVGAGTAVHDGDEVAFFPPVTGGAR